MNYTDPNRKCQVCKFRGVDLHHVKSRKSGGSDDSWNLMPLCHKHHVEIHQIGLITFSKRYNEARWWLLGNSWKINDITQKWYHEEG